MPYYNGEDVTELLREYFINVGSDDGWSCRIGPEETPLSKQIIQAAKSLSRPMVELCINEDTSDSLWECACKSIAQGDANPSLYHYGLYMKCMRERFPEIPEEDLQRFCGCGPFGEDFYLTGWQKVLFRAGIPVVLNSVYYLCPPGKTCGCYPGKEVFVCSISLSYCKLKNQHIKRTAFLLDMLYGPLYNKSGLL